MEPPKHAGHLRWRTRAACVADGVVHVGDEEGDAGGSEGVAGGVVGCP